jgi:CheY-like chemotaxis protein
LCVFLGELSNSHTSSPKSGHRQEYKNHFDSDERSSATEDSKGEVSIPIAPELVWLAKTIGNQFRFRDFEMGVSRFDEQPPAIIYVFSASRDDPISTTVQGIYQQFPNTEVRVILGDWWSGHRRTQALPKGMASAYWYQVYDLILPELQQISDDYQKGGGDQVPTKTPAMLESDQNSENSEGSYSVTRGTITTLVISDHAENRRLWAELGSNLGLTTVGIRGIEELPEGSFAIVILDHRLDGKIEEIEMIRRAYPEARFVVGLNFPSWRTVEPCLFAGVDWFVGKPFQLAGLARTFSSAALGRR